MTKRLRQPASAGLGDRILLSHGSGGRLQAGLLRRLILRELTDKTLARLGDSAEIRGSRRMALTTDTYTVTPMVFPGGDIGKLAVCGTVNDLAAAGAKPEHMTFALVLEEGLETSSLRRVVRSAAAAARRAGVRIVAGDTKVVEKGGCDGLFINTSGVGKLHPRARLSADRIRPGDKLLVSGTIGDHGAAVLCARQDLGFTGLRSDCAALWGPAKKLLDSCDVKLMRDPTRGGLATVLNEIAEDRGFGIEVLEASLPVREPVRAFCEVLGLDPLYSANEGKLAAVVAGRDAGRALKVLRSHPLGRDAALIGSVVRQPAGRVFLTTGIGGRRILDMLAGDQFPRIC